MATIKQEGQIFNSLKALGLNDTAAAGVMGNMSQESSINPNAPGGGLMQWIGSRWTALVNYAKSKNLDPKSTAAQVGYFGQELNAGNEGITLQGLNAQPNPAAAALYVSNNYERPDPAAANNANRESQAQYYYNNFSHGGAAADGSIQNVPGMFSDSSGSSGSVAPSHQGAQAFPTGTDIIQEVNDSLTLSNFDILHPVNSLAQDAGAIALRTLLVIIGLILIIFGLVAIVEKAGVVPPVPVPV